MSRCISNNTASQCPMSNYSEMYGDASYNYHNSRWNCEGTPQYPYTQQDHEGLRYLGVKNYAVAHTLDGQPVYKPVDERAYSCDCNLENPDNFQFMRNPYNYEARKGRFSRGCDCHNRNGMQDQCARQDHQDRWRCYGPQNPRSEVPRLQYEAHQHHRPGTPQHPQCSCGH